MTVHRKEVSNLIGFKSKSSPAVVNTWVIVAKLFTDKQTTLARRGFYLYKSCFLILVHQCLCKKCYVYKSYIVDAASYVNCFFFFIIKSLFPLTELCNYAMYDTCSPKLLWKREPEKLLQASYRNMMQQPIFFILKSWEKVSMTLSEHAL